MNSDVSSQTTLLRRLAWVGVVLMLLVTTSSAYLRLRAAGLGCADWPQCYGRAASDPSVATSSGIAAARVAHRVSASAAGALALFLVVLTFARRRRESGPFWASVMLVVLAGMLAYLGRVTPQARIAAVAMGNLVGGMGMAALFAYIVARTSAFHEGVHLRHRLLLTAVLGLTCLQLAYGAMTSASYSGLACTTIPHCAEAWWPSDATWSAFDPWRAVSRDAGVANMALHMMHRYGGMLLGIMVSWLALHLIRQRAIVWGAALLALVAAQWSIGGLMLLQSLPIALALTHNVLAALLLAVLAALAGHHRSERVAP